MSLVQSRGVRSSCMHVAFAQKRLQQAVEALQARRQLARS